jgi:hypothetical protein
VIANTHARVEQNQHQLNSDYAALSSTIEQLGDGSLDGVPEPFESTFYRLIRFSSGPQGAGYCVFDKFLGGIFARELQLNA